MLANALLLTTETTICQATKETKKLISMVFCNNDTSARTITVYAYPSTGTAAATSTIINTLPIAALDTFTWTAENPLMLATGDKVSGLASVTGVISVLANYEVLS